LMPGGLVDILTPGERLDLYAFLMQLGKPGPYDASKQNVARVWRINAATNAANDDNILKSDVLKWTALYTTVSGDLPKEDLEAETDSAARREPIFAASRFQTAKAGPVKLKLSGVNSPKAWIDGKPVGGNSDIAIDLPAGAHTFVLKVNTRDIEGAVRLETPDGSFLVD